MKRLRFKKHDMWILKYKSLVLQDKMKTRTVAEFKEFERRFKFKPRFKYGWFHLKLYQMFQKQILRFKRLYKSFLIQCKIVNDLNSCFLSK